MHGYWDIVGRSQKMPKDDFGHFPSFKEHADSTDKLESWAFILVSVHPSALPSCHPLWNESPMKKRHFADFADLAPKIGCHGNVPWVIAKWIQTEHLQPHVYQHWKLVKIGLVGSEISLLQTILKRKKVTAVKHKIARSSWRPAWRDKTASAVALNESIARVIEQCCLRLCC